MRPSIEPMPPAAPATLPWIGAGLRLLCVPTAFMAAARRAHGDTFVVDAFGHLLDRYDVTPEFTTAAPSARQLGAVARAAAPCVVRYRERRHA